MQAASSGATICWQVPGGTVEVGTDTMRDHREYDPRTGRMRSERTTVRDGVERTSHFFVRMFSATELADWFRGAGFVDVQSLAGDGGELTMASRRMMVVGAKDTGDVSG